MGSIINRDGGGRDGRGRVGHIEEGMLVVGMKWFLTIEPVRQICQASYSRGVVSPLQNWLITAKHEQTRLRTTDWRADLELSIADP
jgi:hypothetical protein